MKLTHLIQFAQEKVTLGPLPNPPTNPDRLEIIVNFIFGLAGALALLFVVIGGLRYIISQGDPSNAAQAKNTIIYALVGLVITVTAYAIVRFVVSTI